MAEVLVLIDHVDGTPKKVSYELLTLARELGTPSAVVLGAGAAGAADVVVALILVAATLESVFGFCLGCTIFGALMRSGVIPESVCEECNAIGARTGVAA